MTFTVKFYDVLLLCSDSNVLPSKEYEPSMQMHFVLSGVSSPILIRSLVLMSFMLLKLRSTVAVVTGKTAKIIAYTTRLVKAAAKPLRQISFDKTWYIELPLFM